MKNDFQVAFRQEAARAGYSQRKIARELGISTTAVYYWAAGRATPTVENCARLESMFGCERGTLLFPLAYPASVA